MRSFLAAIFAIFASTSTWAQTVCPTHQINAINRGQSTWMAGPNFPGYTLEELSRRNGARLDPNRQLPLKTPEPVPDIPDTFDARANWPNCESTSAIRDQGNCGSCWAFGAAEAMSDRLCIASHGAVKFEYSPEDILACCTNCGSGCEGGFSAQAWAFWVSNGVVSGGDYNSNRGCQPYSKSAHEDNVTPKCETTCLNTAHNVTYNEDKRFGTSNYRISANVTHIQTEIMTNGPVEGVFTVYEDFFCYRTGVYQHTFGNSTGRHAIKILGWGVENNAPYWLVANSWGTGWGGLGGFFKFLRGENHCGIESSIVAGAPRL